MKAALIISHGSRSKQTLKEIKHLLKELKKSSDIPIWQDAYLEIEYPSISQGIDLCIKKGAKEIVIILNFLNAGRHTDADIPTIVEEAQEKHPKIKIALTEPVGRHPGIHNLFLDLAHNNPELPKAQYNDFAKDLLKWYNKEKRDLPWRKTKDPYKIWISEIMLQQTTVNAVIPYYEKWVKKYPTIKKLANAKIQSILNDWQGLGYYNRAKNLHKAAQLIVAEHNSQIPQDPEVLKTLPGFGPYTTASVSSIAFDTRIPLVDANVRRVFMRQLAIKDTPNTKHDEKITKHLESIFPKKHAGDFNQALMELGALICRSKEPLCNTCAVQEYCKGYLRGIQEVIPYKQSKNIKEIYAAIGIIEHKGKFFIQKRPSKGLLADLWEFPGGKIEEGEKAPEALKREFKEEIDSEVESSEFICKLTHFYTSFKVNLNVRFAKVNNLPKEDKTHKFVSLKDLEKYPMPSGSAKIVDRLKLIKSAQKNDHHI